MFPVGARIADRHPCLSAKNLELCAYTWRSAAASCVTKSIPIRFSLRSFLSFPPPDFRMEMEKFLLSSGRSYKMDKIFSYRDWRKVKFLSFDRDSILSGVSQDLQDFVEFSNNLGLHCTLLNLKRKEKKKVNIYIFK